MRTVSILSTAALLLAGAAAQRPAFLMLRDPQRQPVEGALGLVLADPPRELPALDGLGGVELFFGREPTVVGAGPSRRTGTLQLGGGGDQPRAGAVLVLADVPDGHLSGLVERMLPGDADKLQLTRAATVRGPESGAAITLYPAALIGDRRVVLPALRGEVLPLPPGRYEAWIEIGGTFVWQRLELAPGETCTVKLDGERRELERSGGEVVTPTGRGDVVLLDAERARCNLVGAAAKAPLTRWQPDTGRLADGDEPVLELRPQLSASPTGVTRGFVLSRNAFGSWRVRGANQADDDGVLRLPRVTGGDDWLLIDAGGHAPFAVPLAEFDPSAPLAIAAGTALTARCRLEGGDPARDVVFEFVPASADAATVRARSDRRGVVDLGRVSLPGAIRASDPRYANFELELTAVPDEGVALELGRGFEVRGVVRLPDGRPATGVSVTLRAPHDDLRPRQRATVTADDGSFTFGGLTENHEYILFATTRRLGKTWSSKVGRFLAGPQPLTITIRNEDPQLGPGR